jgi:hypothetical protein
LPCFNGIQTGQPVSWKRAQPSTSWYKLATEYAAMKWRYASPNHRRGIAEALTDATEAMLTSEESPYTRDEIRQVLRIWAFSDGLRGNIQPPEDIAAVLRWLETATIPVADLTRPQTGAVQARALLDRISKKKDGTLAAPNTANRKRMVIGNGLEYAVENSVLPNNPVRRISWRKPQISGNRSA